MTALSSSAAQYIACPRQAGSIPINSKGAIAAYATARGLEIVASYEDEGRSGARLSKIRAESTLPPASVRSGYNARSRAFLARKLKTALRATRCPPPVSRAFGAQGLPNRAPVCRAGSPGCLRRTHERDERARAQDSPALSVPTLGEFGRMWRIRVDKLSTKNNFDLLVRMNGASQRMDFLLVPPADVVIRFPQCLTDQVPPDLSRFRCDSPHQLLERIGAVSHRSVVPHQ